MSAVGNKNGKYNFPCLTDFTFSRKNKELNEWNHAYGNLLGTIEN